MAETQTYYDSPLTGEELDAAFRKIPQIDAGVAAAAQSAELSKSWAQGGTGGREDEELNNARYWCEQAQTVVNGCLGWYADAEQLKTACPAGSNGQWAIVGSTDTIWIWDSEKSAWVDSGEKTDLSDYYTKEQVRALTVFVYRATFLLDAWTPGEDGGVTQTATLTAMDGGPAVTASGTLLASVGIDSTLPQETKDAMAGPAADIAGAEKTLGANAITVTLDAAPDVDVELYFTIKQGDD